MQLLRHWIGEPDLTGHHAKQLGRELHHGSHQSAPEQCRRVENHAMRGYHVEEVERDAQHYHPLEHAKQAAKKMVHPSGHQSVGQPAEQRRECPDANVHRKINNYSAGNVGDRDVGKRVGPPRHEPTSGRFGKKPACDYAQHNPAQRGYLRDDALVEPYYQ